MACWLSIATLPTAIPAALAATTSTSDTQVTTGLASHKNNDAGTLETQALLNLAIAHPVMAGIDLSDDQYSQLYAATETTREQIVAIVTPEQQIQFQTTLAATGDVDTAVKAMNLSSQQKSQLEFVVQVFGFQAASILTPEQQRILSRNMESL